MIQTEHHLEITRRAIANLEAALSSLKRDVLPVNPARFALMAEPIVDQLRELRGQVDDYVGVTSAIMEEANVWLRLAGPEIETGDAPTSIVTAMLDTLRRSVQTVAEYLHRGQLAMRPTDDLKRACDLRIVGWLPGSVQVGLRLPAAEPALFDDATAAGHAHQALSLYLQTAAWAGSRADDASFEAAVPDAERRRLLLNQVARIVPRRRGGLDSVELFGRAIGADRARLTRESHERVRRAITRTVEKDQMTTSGILRQIDLDQRTFTLRDPDEGVDIRCVVATDNDDLLEIAKHGLDHRVSVIGVRDRDPARRQAHPLQALEIEVLEHDD